MRTVRARAAESEPPERTQRAGPAEPRAPAAAPATQVLHLQRQAGNRAVAALLARAPTDRAGGRGAQGHPRGRPEARDDRRQLLLGGRGLPPRSHNGTGNPNVRDVVLSSDQGKHSSDLARALIDGRSLGTIELVVMRDGEPVYKIKLVNAFMSSYSVAAGAGGRPPEESWSLVFDGLEMEYLHPPAGE